MRVFTAFSRNSEEWTQGTGQGMNLGHTPSSATQELLTGPGKVTSLLWVDNPPLKHHNLTKASSDPKVVPHGGLLQFSALTLSDLTTCSLSRLSIWWISTSIPTSEPLLLTQCLAQNQGKEGGMNEETTEPMKWSKNEVDQMTSKVCLDVNVLKAFLPVVFYKCMGLIRLKHLWIT